MSSIKTRIAAKLGVCYQNSNKKSVNKGKLSMNKAFPAIGGLLNKRGTNNGRYLFPFSIGMIGFLYLFALLHFNAQFI